MKIHANEGGLSIRGQLARGGRPGPEEMEVRLWRYKQLSAMGYDEREAVHIARDRCIDLEDARKLIENGCPPRLAVMIL